MNDEDLRKENNATPRFVREIIGHGHEREPLRYYAGFAATFLCLNTLALRSLGTRPLARPGIADVMLFGLATNRLSRLVTREKVTRVLRAPFTEVDEGADPSEVHEHPRGTGLRRAFGEFVTCPRCTAMWAASALSLTFVRSPNAARFVAMVLSAAAISDYVNARHAALRDRST